jgi:hypothetical protein
MEPAYIYKSHTLFSDRFLQLPGGAGGSGANDEKLFSRLWSKSLLSGAVRTLRLRLLLVAKLLAALLQATA